MIHRLARTAACVLALTGLASAASAHHSFAMFDLSRVIVLKGVVKDVTWSNPHVVIRILVTPQPTATAAQLWTIELTSPGNLRRGGWTSTTLKEGDPVEMKTNPLRDGTFGGGFYEVKLLTTGQVLTRPGNAPERSVQ